jgi:hypothetical protein
MYSVERSVERIKRTLSIAKSKHVLDFVVNACSDVLV